MFIQGGRLYPFALDGQNFQPWHARLRENRTIAVIGVRAYAPLSIQGRIARWIVQQAQRVGGLGKRVVLDYPIAPQSQSCGMQGEYSPRRQRHRTEIFDASLAESRQLARPAVVRHPGLALDTIRMILCKFAASKIRNAAVRVFALAIELAVGELRLAALRQIAYVFLRGDLDFELSLQRQAVKTRGFREHAIDQILRNAVILDEEKSQAPARRIRLGGCALQRARLTRKVRPKIDDRNGFAGVLGFLRFGLVHGASLALG